MFLTLADVVHTQESIVADALKDSLSDDASGVLLTSECAVPYCSYTIICIHINDIHECTSVEKNNIKYLKYKKDRNGSDKCMFTILQNTGYCLLIMLCHRQSHAKIQHIIVKENNMGNNNYIIWGFIYKSLNRN